MGPVTRPAREHDVLHPGVIPGRDLVEACRAAMRGETFLYPPTVGALLRAWLDDPTRAPANDC